jgi:hypothetical protein
MQAGDLIAQGNVGFGQGLKATVIVHVGLDLGGLLLGNAVGKFLAMEEALQDVIRAALGRGAGAGREELLAQGTTPETVNGLHLLEDVLALLEELVEIQFHRHSVSIQIHYPSPK